MKTRNLITALFTALLFCMSHTALANDSADESAEQMNTQTVTVNVNEADAATLANALVGIGITRAQAIVDYREKHGPFYSAEELTAVKGIGKSTIARNLARITVQ